MTENVKEDSVLLNAVKSVTGAFLAKILPWIALLIIVSMCINGLIRYFHADDIKKKDQVIEQITDINNNNVAEAKRAQEEAARSAETNAKAAEENAKASQTTEEAISALFEETKKLSLSAPQEQVQQVTSAPLLTKRQITPTSVQGTTEVSHSPAKPQEVIEINPERMARLIEMQNKALDAAFDEAVARSTKKEG